MRRDPHSYTDLDQGQTRHLDLDWVVDMERRELRGSATLIFKTVCKGPLDLDTRDLHIESVHDADGPLPWSVDASDPVLGARLRIERPRPTDTVRIRYRTGDASGLMWLEPEQTSGDKPFMLSQCQAIHARSLVPCQDSPRARITYAATLTLPEGMHAVMSAAPGDATADGRLAFSMPQPIPPYLLALAVGQLEHRDLGPRTRVYAEPSVIEQAAWEFHDTERMLTAAEDLFGPYAWDRFDFIVLPASFPLGGMENPRMTFLTPTLLAGDRSLVSVLTHELAHSWTGNLVTNADNEHFWLNEGWTVYAERRILEALYGTERAVQGAALGRVHLDAVLQDRAAKGQTSALTYPQQGLDPDEEFSLVPYEKGFLLLVALEQAVGRERFDAYVRAYIERFAFQSIDTDTFLAFTAEQLGTPVDLDPWLHGEGLPKDAPTFRSKRLDTLEDLARRWHDGARPEVDGMHVVEMLFYLSMLPTLDHDSLEELDALFHLRDTGNAELRSVWLTKAATLDSEADAIEAFVGTVGRTKLLRPVMKGLVDAGKHVFAQRLLRDNRARLHGSTRGALESVVGA